MSGSGGDGSGSYSRGGSPGMNDEFADPLEDDDYDSEIEYDDEFESSMKVKKEITFEDDY